MKRGLKNTMVLLVCILLLSGCASTHMPKPEARPELAPQSDSATLVIIRDTWFGGGIVFWNYLDGKLIGETMGNTYFVSYIPPGPHYVVSVTENTGIAHFDFQPGKIYYLRQGVTMGGWRARTSGFFPLTPDEAVEAIKGCTYLEYDPKKGGEDMNPQHYQQAIQEYHADVQANPAGYKELLEYKGH
jgi:hypothetical protein